MQINPVYFRGPLLILLVLLLWGDPSHSKISEETAVDEDVLDDVLEQEDGPASQRMKQILDSFSIPSKSPTGEPADEVKLVQGAAKSFSVRKLGQAPTPIQSDSKPATGDSDGEKLIVEGAVKSFSEVTKLLGQAPTPIQPDPALLQKETAEDGKVDTGYVVKEQNEFSLTETTMSPQPPSDNNSNNRGAEISPVVSFYITFATHFIEMC
jgi:hypothetical protein